MTIHDLAAQYRADGKARVFVEAVWRRIREEYGQIKIYDDPYCDVPSPFESWTAAAEFTISRIEEIRLSEEDNLLIFKKMAACYLRRKESYQRILFRERAHLDSLCEGVRKEVLA